MVPYYGDFAEDATVYMVFNTFSSDDPSASVTITDFINTDVHIHKNNGLTQRNNAAGITVSVDFDGITGSHMIVIDTNDNTVGGFWVTGADYFIRIEGTTVDGGTINAMVGHFSIENRYNPVTDYDGPTKAEMDTAHALLATPANVATELGTYDAPTKAEMDTGHGLLATEAKQDIIDINVDQIETAVITNAAGTDVAADIIAVKAETATIVTDTNELQTDDVPGLIAALNDPASAAIADAVWDEILTGATHNIATSAGRRLRGIQDFQGYEDGAIWIDTVNGTAGTVDYENGTVENPVKTLADALTISASLNIKRFKIAGASTITLSANSDTYVFEGWNWTLALNGQSIVGIRVVGAAVSGIAAGTGAIQIFDHCIMNVCSHIKGTRIINSAIANTQTTVEAGDFFFDNCHSAIAGTATWVFDFGGAIGNTNLGMRHYSGGIQLENMGDAGTDTMSLEGYGQIIEGTCTGGTVAIRGNFTTSGITNLTLSDDARFDNIDITAIKAKTDNLPSGPAKNVALSNFAFLMVDSTDHVTGKTGLTVTAEISKDGGAFAGATNSATEIANGLYKINWTQAEINADIIILKFTAAGADQRTVVILTS